MIQKSITIRELKKLVKEVIKEDVNLRALGRANFTPDEFKGFTDAEKKGSRSIKKVGQASHAYQKSQSAFNKVMDKSQASGAIGSDGEDLSDYQNIDIVNEVIGILGNYVDCLDSAPMWRRSGALTMDVSSELIGLKISGVDDITEIHIFLNKCDLKKSKDALLVELDELGYRTPTISDLKIITDVIIIKLS